MLRKYTFLGHFVLWWLTSHTEPQRIWAVGLDQHCWTAFFLWRVGWKTSLLSEVPLGVRKMNQIASKNQKERWGGVGEESLPNLT